MVKNQVKRSAFLTLFEKSLANKKAKHIWYSKLGIQLYITSLDPRTARSVFKACVNMYEIKANFKKMYESDLSCPFRKTKDETFEHIFSCLSGLLCKNSGKENNLFKLSHFRCLRYLKDTGEFLHRYKKYREIMLRGRWCTQREVSSGGVAECCGLWVWAFVGGGEFGQECRWLADYFGGIFKTVCLSWGCSWSEMRPIAISVHFSIYCIASNTAFAVQCLSPEYRSVWFLLVFSSTVSCFWVLRKTIS